MIEDEMAGCHHRHDGHEFDQAPGVGDGQGNLACLCPWDHKESDTTEQLYNNKIGMATMKNITEVPQKIKNKTTI